MIFKKTLMLFTALVIYSTGHATQTSTDHMMDNHQFKTAIFAGGCFWCVEADFDKVPGVIDTTSGFTGGHVKDPSYEQVSNGGTGHAESVRITYDPGKVSYKELLDYFWHNIDPTTVNAQFCDHGPQYRSAIFYLNEEQHNLAEQSRENLENTKLFKAPIVTQIVPASTFYPAEDYHQDFHETHELKYKFYRYRCGRDERLEELWGKK